MENEAPLEIPILIVIATIGIILFISFVVFFVLFYQRRTFQNIVIQEEKRKEHQKQMLNATIEIAEMERNRISANLHDDIGSLINLVNINIGNIVQNTEDKNMVTELSKESSVLLERTMENVRSISRDLVPPVLIRLGFEEALVDLCRRINKTGSTKITLHQSSNVLRIQPKIELQLYRIVQEVLNNIIKHASAKEIIMFLQSNTETLILEIKHNGKGIKNDMIGALTESSTGIGLKSIQNRALIINANVNYDINSLTESQITIEAPLYEKTN